jgi:hypothetical protein
MDALLGTVTAYPLTEEFETAWNGLPKREGQHGPRYSALATGLVAATGRPVRLFGHYELAEEEKAAGSRALLLTGDSAFDHRLRLAVRAWEGHVRDGRGTPALAGLLPEPEKERSFADFGSFRTGQAPVLPGWAYRTAEWQVMRKLAEARLRVDGRDPVELTMDTDGSLLSWDPGDLIVHRSGTAFSMHRVTARLTTRIGIEDPVLCFDASLSRISPQGDWAKHVWIDRGEKGAPILRLPLHRRLDKKSGTWRSHLDSAIAKILEVCQLKALVIPEELPQVPGVIRPHLAAARYQKLGSGPGPRFMMRLHEHIVATLPLLVPLSYEPDKRIRLGGHVKGYAADGLPTAAVGPSGFERVTLVCVYATAEGRHRMLNALGELVGRPVRLENEDSIESVNDRLDVVARHRPDLLAHDTVNRAALLGSLNIPVGEDDHVAAAWMETEYHPDSARPRIDAKPHLRRLLGHLGTPTQFLATAPTVLPPNASPHSAETHKHAARAALRDLLRAAGVMDDRLLEAVAAGAGDDEATRPVLLVGIHVRRQQTGRGSAPLVITMVALYVVPDDLAGCEVLVYSERRRRWLRSARGIADFHTGAIGSSRFGRRGEKTQLTRDMVEDALADLLASKPDGTRMVVFVDALETRTIWPGLQNARNGDGVLPADTLRHRGADVAIVRVNAAIQEIGRPVTRREKKNMPSDPAKPAAPGRQVYRLAEGDGRSWLFAGRSRVLKAKGGDRGAYYTRWTLPDMLMSKVAEPWHSYTGKEIVVVSPGSWAPERLAGLTASLCEQAVSWDDRTQRPVPLHLATAIDEDHPEYRASGEED